MIGSYIRQLREDKGYLLRQMAALLDVDATILSKMERGERSFKREQIIKIAEACGSDEDNLLTLWLADKITRIIDDERCAIQALDFVMKQNE